MNKMLRIVLRCLRSALLGRCQALAGEARDPPGAEGQVSQCPGSTACSRRRCRACSKSASRRRTGRRSSTPTRWRTSSWSTAASSTPSPAAISPKSACRSSARSSSARCRSTWRSRSSAATASACWRCSRTRTVPYCRRLEQSLLQIDDITIYVFMYPVIRPDAADHSRAVWCAPDRVKAWLDLAAADTPKVPPGGASCANPVDKVLELGRSLRVTRHADAVLRQRRARGRRHAARPAARQAGRHRAPAGRQEQ